MQVALVQATHTGHGAAAEEGQLDDVPCPRGGGHEPARIGGMDPDLGAIENMARTIREIVTHQADHVRVELDRVDPCRAVADGLKNRPACARAEHQNLGAAGEMIGQRIGRVVEIGEAFRATVPGVDRRRELAVGEDAELRRRQRRRAQAEAGGIAKRNRRAVDHREQREGAGILAGQPCVADRQRPPQPLEFGDIEGDPGGRRRRPGDRADHRNAGNRDQPAISAPAEFAGGGGGQSDPRDQRQTGHRRGHGERGDTAKRAGARAEQVPQIDPARRGRGFQERQADAGRAGGERDNQQEVDDAEIEQLRGRPDHLERVEGQALGQQEGDRGGGREHHRRIRENVGGAGLDPILEDREQGTADAESEQRDADRQVGEKMPLDDREQPDQQHLVGQDRRRDHRHRRMGDHCPPRVKGTKRTGRSWRVSTSPAPVFSTSVRCCVANMPPTGITMRPPGFS